MRASTQKGIAKRLKISQATVSMALQNNELISPDTRQKVLELAATLGYRHNQSAKALRKGNYGNIALLVSTKKEHSFLPTDLLRGIRHETRIQQTQLTIAEVPDEELLDDAFIHTMLRQWSSDGLLIDYTHNLPSKMVDLIQTYRIPSVWLNADFEYDSVYPDDFSAIQCATQKLLELGHSRIGYLDLTRTMHYSARARYDGYMSAMHAKNYSPIVLTVAIERNKRLDALRKWLKSPQAPTAVITYEDREAIPLFAAALEAGLKIPDDLSIVAVHDRVVDSVGIPLTTSQTDFTQIGTLAVRMLLEKIKNPKRDIPSIKTQALWHSGESVTSPNI